MNINNKQLKSLCNTELYESYICNLDNKKSDLLSHIDKIYYYDSKDLNSIFGNMKLLNIEPVKLTICIMTYNEERCIERCLNSIINIADEIVVLDTGSTDSTIDIISKNFPHVKLMHFKWNDDFSYCRNLLIDHSRNDFILQLDADEYLDENFYDILYLLKLFEPSSQYPIVFSPTIINHDHSKINLTQRIFNKKSNFRYYGLVHEQLTLENIDDYISIQTDFKIYHDGYKENIMYEKDKLNRNIKLLEIMNKNEPQSIRWSYFLAREYAYNDINIELSKKLLKSIIDSNKNSIDDKFLCMSSLVILCNLLYQNNEFDELKKYISIIKSVDNNCVDYYYYKLLLYSNDNNIDLSKLCKQFINDINLIVNPISYIHSEFYHLYQLFGEILFLKGEYKLALKIFNRIKYKPFLQDTKDNFKELYYSLHEFLEIENS